MRKKVKKEKVDDDDDDDTNIHVRWKKKDKLCRFKL